MKFTKSILASVITLTLSQIMCPRLAGSGGGNSYIIVQKSETFDQTASTGAVADPLAPFTFNVSGPVAMSFTPPGGTSTALTAYQGGSGTKYEFSMNYASQAAMDAAFPNGSYTYAVTGSSNFSLTLTGNLYPSTPQVTGGTWNSSGQLVLDPTQDNTLNFIPFTAYGTAGIISHMQIQIQSFDGSTVNLSQTNITPTNSTGFTSYLIPAGTLSAGSIYECNLEYDTGVADNTTAVSGDTAVTIYTASTNFFFVTSGTPANVPTITQQPTDQQAPVGSSVTFGLQFGGGNNVMLEWFKNGLPINQNSQNGSNLTLTNIQNSDAASYFAIIANGAGAYVQSDTVTLTIGASLAASPVF